MASSPRRSELYRSRAALVMALAFCMALVCAAQLNRKAPPPQGPRATALVELMPNGQAHLIPIVILIDGKYYDAASYKASPVPMALESGTVYEALRTGISQGLFTVGQVRQVKDSWIADGALRVASPEKPKLAAAPSHGPDEDISGPPKLRRSQPAPSEPSTPAAAPANSTPTATTTPPPTTPSAPEAAKADNPTPDSPEISAPDDPNRPMLHRGKSTTASAAQAKKSVKPATSATTPVAKTSTPAKSETGTVQFIPAISDAHPYEPHPYTFDMKPDEEQRFRNKMLALAADEVRARDKQLSGTAQPEAPAHPAAKVTASKTRSHQPPAPNFDDVQLRVFDLSYSNEPTLVLTASAHMPQAATGSSDRQYFITLVARNDIYNELHKGFVNLTDSQHRDVISRMDLIDAVDVDGDGRGELLFRQTSDTGKGYIIYRVIGDQLYSLYQSSAGQ